MKRFMIFLLISIILIPQGFSFSYGTGTVQKLSHYQVNSSGSEISSAIYEGDKFKLKVEFINNTNEPLSDISILPSGSSPFSYYNSASSNNTVAIGERFYVIVDLAYNGGDNTFPFTLNYKQGAESKSVAYSAYINDIGNNSAPPPSTPVDTSKYVPRPIIVNQEIPTVGAGQTLELNLTIKNNSGHSAKDVIITPLFEETPGTPFVLDVANMKRTINSLPGNQSEKIQFKLQIDKLAQAKTHALKIRFEGFNAYGHSFSTTETIYITVTNQNTTPKIMVSKIDLKPQRIQAGEQAQLDIYLKNNGTLTAKNLQISLEGLSSNGFTVTSNTNSRFVKEVKGNLESYLVFDLHASSKLTNGNHSLTLKINYQDERNQSYTEEHVFFLPVGNDIGKRPELEIQNIQAPKNSLEVNDSFQISFDVVNLGEAPARNVKVLVNGEAALLPKSQNIQLIQTLQGKEKRTMEFSFYVSSEASSQNHPLRIEIEYDQEIDGTIAKETIKQFVGINVDGTKASKNTTPKIIIDEYRFEPHIVRAGENFDLMVSFLNTNQAKGVENIKIFLTVNETTNESGNVFTPVNSSNTFFIDYIPPKGRVERNLTLYAVPDAKPKTYTITANFEYEDAEGKQYQATELIGIPVVQQSRLEVNDFSLPSESFIGQPIPIFLEFYNMGKVTLNNLMIKVEGDFQSHNSTYFVGNFQTGSREYYETMIIPMNPGSVEGAVVFTYEDSAGEQVELRKPISLNVMEMPQEMFPPDMGEFPPHDFKEPLVKRLLKNKFLWGAIIIVALGGGFLVWKRIKKKKGMAADEIY